MRGACAVFILYRLTVVSTNLFLRLCFMVWMACGLGPLLLPAQSLQGELSACVRQANAEVGVAVVRDGRVIARVNDRVRYPLMSVMKLYQGMHVAAMFDGRKASLDTLLTVTRDDLKPDTYSPLREAYPEGDFTMSVARLLDYSIQQSDNNACDILFRLSGGPAATDRYVRGLGLRHFALRHTEDEMHRDASLWAANWSRPSEAARLIYRLFEAARFDGPAMSYLRHSLEQCQTGRGRLSAPLLPVGAVVAHKTGTGDRVNGRLTGINDVAYVTLPNGRSYAIAVFIRETPLPMPEAERLIADLSAIALRWLQ